MDLMLSNFVVDNPPLETKNRTNHENGGAGFSMSFNKALPSKAVVARKRNVSKVLPQPAERKPIPSPAKSAKQQHSIAVHNGTADKSSAKRSSSNNQPETTTSTVNKSSTLRSRGVQHTKLANPEGRGEMSVVKRVSNFVSNGKVPHRHHSTSIFERLKTDLPKIDFPLVQPLEEQVFSEQSIDELEIHPHTKKNIADLLHYAHLTMVQSMAIPQLMEGRDALIRAQTGSGKTLAYALPLIEQLHTIRPKTSRTDGIQAVVIVPTRELALQTYELMVKLLKPYTWIVSGYLCGGEKRKTEKARLRAGLNILIGTPGRFCDHIRNTETLKLANVRWLVLDEADRLLELGYEKDVKEIVGAIQGGRSGRTDDDGGGDVPQAKNGSLQTVLLSATLTASVKELAGLTLHDPVYVETSDAIRKRPPLADTHVDGQVEFPDHLLNVDECVTIPATVKQRYLVVPPKLRLVTLSGLIAHEQHKKPSKALIFMATQDMVDFHHDVMVEALTTNQLDSDDEREDDEREDDDDNNADEATETVLLPRVGIFKLHGGMTQVERIAVFQKFRTEKAAVLLCTDMVARGIDIPSVDLVVQYHAAQTLADYVHRVGRTARAGQTGKAILFIDPAEMDYIKYLADKQIRIQEQKIDGIFVHLGQQLKCGQKRISRNKEQAAIVLQHRFEQLVAKEKHLFSSASKAFVSWVRYYSNFPRELRHAFAIKAVHMGHYAQCLGLRDAPTQLMRPHTGPRGHAPAAAGRQQQQRRRGGFASRTTGRQRDEATAGRGGPMLAELAKRSRVLNTSEFDSGLGPARKKGKRC